MTKMRIGILGAGLMGHGIAQVFALAGHAVRVFDPMEAARTSLRDRIRTNLRDLEQDQAAADRVDPAATVAEAVGDADFVVEAALEDLAVKQQLFAFVPPRRAVLIGVDEHHPSEVVGLTRSGADDAIGRVAQHDGPGLLE